MALDVATLRKLLALDPADPLSQFALGKKLFETSDAAGDLEEAATHLGFANEKSPGHLATYHIYGQVLAKLGRVEEARGVLAEGVRRASAVGEGMGRDLGPLMQDLLERLG